MAKYESNVKLHVKQVKHIVKRRNIIYLWKNRLNDNVGLNMGQKRMR